MFASVGDAAPVRTGVMTMGLTLSWRTAGAILAAAVLLLIALPSTPAQAYWYGPPQNLRSTDLGGGRTQFNWDPPNPANYMGITPTSYWVTITTSGYRTHRCEGSGYSSVVSSTSCIVAGLPYGEAVTLKVQAWNPYIGDDAITTFVLCCELPAAPTTVTASSGDGTASLTWGPPSNAGRAGQAFTYNVEIRPGGAVCTTADRTCQIGGLTNGVAYTFYVSATNSTGTGQATGSNAVTPIGPPSPPQAVRGFLLERGQVNVTWQGPTNTGGSPINRYVAVSEPGGLTCESSSGLQCTMAGLSNGTAYSFTVTAFNAAGQSGASAASPAAKVLSGPGRPTRVRAARSGTSATISWNAPKSTGGSPIKGYVVTASPSGKTCKVSKPVGCTIRGLSVGNKYVFTVQARNAKAAGLPETSNGITVPVPPPPPKETQAIS